MIQSTCNKPNSKSNTEQRKWRRPVISPSEEQQVPSMFAAALSMTPSPATTGSNNNKKKKKKKKNKKKKTESNSSSLLLKNNRTKDNKITDIDDDRELKNVPTAFRSSASPSKFSKTMKSNTTTKKSSIKGSTKKKVTDNNTRSRSPSIVAQSKYRPGPESGTMTPQKKKDKEVSSKRTKHKKKDGSKKTRLSSSSSSKLVSSVPHLDDDRPRVIDTLKNTKKVNDVTSSFVSPSPSSSMISTTTEASSVDISPVNVSCSKRYYKYLGSPTPKSGKKNKSKIMSVFSQIPKQMQHYDVDDTRLPRSRNCGSSIKNSYDENKDDNDISKKSNDQNHAAGNYNCIDTLTTQQRMDLIRALYKLQEEQAMKELTKPIDVKLADDALSVLKKAKMENDRIVDDIMDDEDYDYYDDDSSSSSCYTFVSVDSEFSQF